MNPPGEEWIGALGRLLAREPDLQTAILFGSLAAKGAVNSESDLDLAVGTGVPMTAARRQQLADQVAGFAGRPVDLIDLAVQSGPLLGNILRHGIVVLERDPAILGRLYERFLDWQEDLAPAVRGMLAARRRTTLPLRHG